MVNRGFLTLILLILYSGISVFGQDSTTLGINEGPVTIEWGELEASYRIEVRRDGQVFIDIEQTGNKLKLNLAPGFYEYRIRVLNPFSKEVSISEWLPLTVESTRIPYFRVRTPLIIWEGDQDVEMLVESSDLRDGTVFALLYGDRQIATEWSGDGNLYFVRPSGSEIGAGSWDLVATDPSGMTFVHPEALIVRPTSSPVIQKLDTVRAAPVGLVPIEISGESFDTEMSIRFEGPGGSLPVAAIEITEGNRALVYLDLTDATPGSYALVATNPAGEETRMEMALTVSDPVIDELIKKQPRFGFQIGYAPTFIAAPDTDLPVYLGFDLAGIFHSGWKAPFLRGVGVEARAFIGATGPTGSENGNIHGIGSLDLSAYYRPLVSGRVAPVFLLGAGNMWSGYAKQFEIQNILFIRTGIGMDITNQRHVTRIGLNISFGASEETFPIFSLMFRRGRRY